MGMVDGDREEIVEELLQAGADINAKIFSGNSVLAIARNTGNQNIVRQLIEAGARDEIKIKE
jgi:ankyrin repeat protein